MATGLGADTSRIGLRVDNKPTISVYVRVGRCRDELGFDTDSLKSRSSAHAVTVVSDPFHLTPGRKRFFDSLSHHPSLMGYRDDEYARCLDSQKRDALSLLSRCEKNTLPFYCSVWHNDGEIVLDLIDAAKPLDSEDLATVTILMNDPFIP